MPVRNLAKQFKVTETQIIRIKKNENWASVEAAKWSYGNANSYCFPNTSLIFLMPVIKDVLEVFFYKKYIRQVAKYP